ncbi:YhcN/YlaJ family sporulation lipoprotein [Cytobacillus suaedae]|nr:YhcN/YlaJ family sporulation lipoprotein [Cytobacillus suaedae]
MAALTGCMNPNEAEVYEESGYTINRQDRNEIYNDDGLINNGDKQSNFGYVRHQKSPVPGEVGITNNLPTLNREVMADLISKISITLPNVNEAATLVTDEEVLVVYETNSENRFETADQVKKSALSVVPRWYHVYVSDNPVLIRDIERFGLLDTNVRDVDQILDATIARMLESPQGRKISTGENENGEITGGMNDEYEERAGEEDQDPDKHNILHQQGKLIDDGHTTPHGLGGLGDYDIYKPEENENLYRTNDNRG